MIVGERIEKLLDRIGVRPVWCEVLLGNGPSVNLRRLSLTDGFTIARRNVNPSLWASQGTKPKVLAAQ